MERYAEVLRPFNGARPYARGEVVEVSGWRWARQLTDRRYIAPCAEPARNAPQPGRPRREEAQ